MFFRRADAGHLRVEPHERGCKRAFRVAGRRVYDRAGGLIDDDNVLVFVDYVDVWRVSSHGRVFYRIAVRPVNPRNLARALV